ncbi:hypothetical protein SteCoe_21763 [Stentor coeruleus]|uniref:C2H2-type domain-containing protein n=1 Tax=Stentor coeruleus TaxID=5963 RepID=A0A1R2BNU7_9CILI|nr:hypothetical protein SteCoe_21763 [Stentor coeruleus]
MKTFEDYIITQYCCMANECGRTYTTKLNLKRHILVSHVKSEKFKCDQCQKCFASKQNLTEHKYLHSGEKPYSCSICKELFRHISSLSLHYKRHQYDQIEQKGISSKFQDKSTQTFEN